MAHDALAGGSLQRPGPVTIRFCYYSAGTQV